MKKILCLLFALAALPFAQAEDQYLCPIMIEDSIEDDQIVTFEGKKIYMCCKSCIKAWKKNPKYYFKIARELDLLPQYTNISPKLKAELAKIKLMKQRFCPVRNDCIVSPESPSIEYEGKKIYFFKKRDIERKWNEKVFKKARKNGLLPQFDEKAADE